MLRILFIAALSVCAGVAFAQQMYRYVDPQGRTVFSDRPPPTGTPYTAHTMTPSARPQTPTPPVVQEPATPMAPTQQYPAGQAPGTLPQSAVPVAPSAARDRRAFVPDNERQIERESMRANMPANEAAREREDVRLNMPSGEAARERQDMRLNMPAGEAAREREDMRANMPADEAAREREGMQLNR